MSFLVVMPTIYPPYRDECIATMSQTMLDNLLVVENSVNNRGLAGSWNIGARRVLEEGLDWLVTISAGMRFDESGGDDFFAQLDTHPDAWVIEGGWDIHKRSELFSGWHYIAWSRRNVLDRIGILDENFWPIYGEDADWSVRLLIALEEDDNLRGIDRWIKPEVDAWLVMQQHSGELAGIRNDYPHMDEYFISKWGRSFGGGLIPTYKRPFNGLTLPLSFWPTPPDPRAREHDGWRHYDHV